ncbi:MAG: DUF4249 domain-containing protein [Salibacteraceae bacterium]
MACLALFFPACQESISINLPDEETKVVVEGYIEQNRPPYLFLTQTTEYFGPTDRTAFEDSFLHEATITVSDGLQTTQLEEYCMNDLSSLERSLFAQATNIPVVELRQANYCVYSIPREDLLNGTYIQGKVGRSYTLRIEYRDEVFSAVTTIPEPVPLDSLWFEVRDSELRDGVLRARLIDPATPGNHYRWQADVIGKGSGFVAPPISALSDETFNGKAFEMTHVHGNDPFTTQDTRFYGSGEKVAVKFSSIPADVYRFVRNFENETANNGNPFAAPSFPVSNIDGEGVLGIWAGYGATYDTILCR